MDPEDWSDTFLRRRLTFSGVCSFIDLHNQRCEDLNSYNMLVKYEQKYIKFDSVILKIEITGVCISRTAK